MNPARGVFTFYVGRMFLLRFLGLLIFFVIILQMLDLLNRSSDIMAAEGANASSLLRYIMLRAPMIASQFTPFAALLGIVMTLAGLSHTSENNGDARRRNVRLPRIVSNRICVRRRCACSFHFT